jgi:thiol-disulfide isomerase/thioredoxin
MNVAEPYPAPELRNVGNWVNSTPLTLASLKGKVVIVDFWTFECINCQRTIPSVNALYAKYHAKGLEIVGVHAPEFDAEREIANVRKAVKAEKIKFPVVQDNDFATWKAFHNRYWPAFYVVDKRGLVRHEHFGEGGYAERDAIVAALLAD